MTGNQINSFVGNLVEMAKAFEELPGVRQALAEAEFNSATLADTIAQREASILRLKAELEAAHEATRKVEAERDEALGSFLAADDRADKILAFVKATFGSAGALIQAVEPPPVAKPEPEQTAKPQEDIQPMLSAIDNPLYGDPMVEAPLHPAPQGESVIDPTPSPSPVNTSEQPERHYASADPTVDPFHPAPEVAYTPSPTPAPSAPTGTGTESGTFGFKAEPDAGHGADLPYFGRRYVDVPGYVSIDDWIAGGGTEYNYYLRP